MTQIYTSNTILATAESTALTTTAGNTVDLSARISFIWVDSRASQRFLIYRWQESADGITWRDIPYGESIHPLSVNNTNKTILYSSLKDELVDLELSEFNIANSKNITANLQIKNILFSQNNYKYRCLVLLYDNTISSIESAGTTNNINITVIPKEVDDPIGIFDIPWDPIDPQKAIQGGSISIDHQSSVEIFKINKTANGTQWRIIEVGHNKVYLSGNIIDGSPVGLPASYGPNTESYPGYMQLQFHSNNTWVTSESWISLVGNSDHVFNRYHPICPVNIDMNGQLILNHVRPGDITDPLVIRTDLTGLCYEIPAVSISGIKSSISQHYNFGQPVVNNPTSCETSIYGLSTISIPEGITLPATVRIVGSADDNLIVNGTPVNPQPCASAGAVDYSFVCDTDSFTLAVIDNYGVGVGYDLKIIFSSNVTNSTLNNVIKKNTINTINITKVSETNVHSISSTQSWQNTGAYVSNNARMLIEATGSFRWNNSGDMATATGVSFSGASIDTRFPHQSLIGRIGLDGEPFYIGEYLKALSKSEGYLQLATNDTERSDNIGALSVKTTILNSDPLGFRILQPNNEPYNPNISDNIFDNVSLLVSYRNNSIIDFSNYGRKFINTNFNTVSSPNLYDAISGSYKDGGYSISDAGVSLAFDADFTIEGWFYFLNNEGTQALISTYNNADATGWLLTLKDGSLYFYGSSIGYPNWSVTINSAYTPSIEEWVHIAVTRTGTSIKLFVNGAIVGALNSSLAISSGVVLEIGNYPYFNGLRKHLKGYINELRITKSYSRYSNDFSANLPNKPFPKQSYKPFTLIDLSKIQKYATTIYNNNDEPQYFVIEGQNSISGPFNNPGDINLVFSYKSPYCTELLLLDIP